MYKKVYIEITNVCNLNCSFCIHNKREPRFMSIEEFEYILKRLKEKTRYLYFHVLGEPLLHPRINEFIELAHDNGFYINITTNGHLVHLIKSKNIRQLNISLHSFEGNEENLDNYLDNIFSAADYLAPYTYINYRLWVGKNDLIIKRLEEKYQVSINDSMKLAPNIFIDIEKPFIWPNLNNNLNQDGKCLGLITHFGVLVDGTIVPCCLDSCGDINLGNIFKEELDDILNQERVKLIRQKFKEGKRKEDLCRHCGFQDRQTK